ncbi:MAG: T9SS type A sorting domain-containing protein [bacterium]|nr:T9SS type A sorting domain-containing protein [bacterium]
MKNTLFSLLFAVCFAVLSFSSASAQLGADPGDRDTLIIDSVIAFLSGTGVLPVSFVNDEVLDAVEVTIRHQESQLAIDSFSFVGGRLLADNSSRIVRISEDSSTITFSYFAYETPALLQPGRGLMGKLYFSYPLSIGTGVIPVDTVTWEPSPNIEHATIFRAVDSVETFVPEVIPGFLDLKETPSSFDSVWIDSVGVEAGLPVEVAIHAYNERPLAEADIVLNWGSAYLIYDSTSFAGTRGITATRTVQPSISQRTLYISLEYGSALPLDSGSGILAVMHFTAAPASPDTLIEIDSTTVGLVTDTEFQLTDLDGGVRFTPLFTSGLVEIKTSTGIEDITPDGLLPEEYALSQNYPNPFNPSTQIELSLPTAGLVELEVFNVLGRKVRRLINEKLPAGVHRIEFDGRSDSGKRVASGVYFYRIQTEDFVQSRKMILLK